MSDHHSDHDHTMVGIGHVLFVGPLLIYLGWDGVKPWWVYKAVLVAGMAGLLFFAYMVVFKRERYWILLHLLIFAPLLIYYGWMGERGHWFARSLLLAIGCAAIGYHIIKNLKGLLG